MNSQELKRRADLKRELIEEAPWCRECGVTYMLDLSHTIPLSRGGKTDRDNCTILCRVCHGRSHHQNIIV